MDLLKKILKVLLAIVLWVIEYFVVFGIGAMPFGKPLNQVSMLVYWIALILFIVLAVFTWRLLFKKKKNQNENQNENE